MWYILRLRADLGWLRKRLNDVHVRGVGISPTATRGLPDDVGDTVSIENQSWRWVAGRGGTKRTSRKLQESVFLWAIFRVARGCACVKKRARGLWGLRIGAR